MGFDLIIGFDLIAFDWIDFGISNLDYLLGKGDAVAGCGIENYKEAGTSDCEKVLGFFEDGIELCNFPISC